MLPSEHNDPRGYLRITRHRHDTGERGEHYQRNLITQKGREVLAQLFSGGTRIDSVWLAIGCGSTPANADQIQLFDEKARVLVDLGESNFIEIDGVQRAVCKVTANFPVLPLPEEGEEDHSQALREAGIYLCLANAESSADADNEEGNNPAADVISDEDEEPDEDDNPAENNTFGAKAGDGVLYNRVVFDTITRNANVSLTLEWEVVF